MSRDLAISGGKRVIGFYEYKPIKMSYHPAKFGVHSQSGCAVIINLVCHVILQDHVIKCLCDL